MFVTVLTKEVGLYHHSAKLAIMKTISLDFTNLDSIQGRDEKLLS